MKKLNKTLLALVLALATVFACAFAIAACGGDDEPEGDYVITVYLEDGTTPLDGTAENNKAFKIQVCQGENCVPLVGNRLKTVDKNGKIAFTQAEINGYFEATEDVTEFHFQVNAANGYKTTEILVNKKGAHKLVLEK